MIFSLNNPLSFLKVYLIKKLNLITAIITLLLSSQLFADVKLPAIIGSNMVLQQNTDVTIWGWAGSEEKITVNPDWRWGSRSTVADEQGRWQVTLKTLKADRPHTMTIRGNNTIKLKNILFGEVWLCSGQSNMQMPMGGWDLQPVHGGLKDITYSANESIRLFTVQPVTADNLADDVVGQWVECLPETVRNFSAVGYYFGRKINGETAYPVGLINSSWGGTLAQAWTRIDFIQYDDNLRPIADSYDTRLADWENACLEAEKEQKPKPKRYHRIQPQDKPASLYNGMIAPITKMTIKGTIWYQGESNAGAAYLYRDLFPTMIENWRCDFKNFEMPFYFVQLASFTDHKPGIEVEPYRDQPRDNGWAELREAQFMTNSSKNTGMAVTIDIGETNNIHPGNKKDVGERLAFWAMAKDYGIAIDYSGPLYVGYRIEGDTIRILFSHAENGLAFKDGIPKGFAIAGSDKQFVWADARIDGTTLLVSSDEIKEPVAVRYAWDIDPENSLYNNARLPASPFRTDDWNGVTFGVK